MLRIRVCVNGREPSIRLNDFESHVLVCCGAGQKDGILSNDRAGLQASDVISPEFEQTLADAAACTTKDLVRLAIRPAFPASSLHVQRPGQLQGDRLLVTVANDNRIMRRLHVMFGNQATFGRAVLSPEGPNDFVWQHMPCRSPALDPQNWERNTRISRRAGALRMKTEASYVQVSSQNLCIGSRVAVKGSNEVIADRQVTLINLADLEFAIRPRVAKGSDREQCRLLEAMPLQSTLTSREIEAYPRHHALVVQRLDDYDHVTYVLACPWMCIGGDPDDDVVVEGLPPSAIVVAGKNEAVYLRLARGAEPATPWLPGRGCWVPIVDGDSIAFGEIAVSFQVGDTHMMLQESSGGQNPDSGSSGASLS